MTCLDEFDNENTTEAMFIVFSPYSLCCFCFFSPGNWINSSLERRMGESVRRKRRRERSTRKGRGAQMKVSAVSVRAVCRRLHRQIYCKPNILSFQKRIIGYTCMNTISTYSHKLVLVIVVLYNSFSFSLVCILKNCSHNDWFRVPVLNLPCENSDILRHVCGDDRVWKWYLNVVWIYMEVLIIEIYRSTLCKTFLLHLFRAHRVNFGTRVFTHKINWDSVLLSTWALTELKAQVRFPDYVILSNLTQSIIGRTGCKNEEPNPSPSQLIWSLVSVFNTPLL